MNNNFILNPDDIIMGTDFESTIGEMFEKINIPIANEYSVTWHDVDFDIIIDSIEADGDAVWIDSLIDITNWTDDDDRIIEGLSWYIENNILQ